MDITYDTKIEKVLSDDKLLKRAIHQELAKIIRRRENEIKSFDNFLEYLHHGLGKPHPLGNDKDARVRNGYGVHLTGNIRLIIQLDCASRSDEALKECKEVKIMGVVDYHGEKNEWIMP